MKYQEIVTLKDGAKCTLVNATKDYAKECLNLFVETHAESDFLLSYPDEILFGIEEEYKFLELMETSERSQNIIAIYDGKVVGSSGIDPIGSAFKIEHRANFGISILEKYQGLGIGRALTNASIICAKEMGYTQMELDVVSTNYKAIKLYESMGFKEFGRNPKGFKMKDGSFFELVLMRLEL